MVTERAVSLSFRVMPWFAQLLERAAALDIRSETNLVETVVLRHCRQRVIAMEPRAEIRGRSHQHPARLKVRTYKQH